MSQEPTRVPVTAALAAELVTSLLPRGRWWPRIVGGQLWQLAAGTGLSILRAHNRLLDLVEEADPRTATQALDAWETVLDPYDCVTPPTSLAARRSSVAAKLAAYGGQSAAYLVAVAAAAGHDIAIEKAHPWRCGSSGIDEPIRDAAWAWTFLVYAPFTAGDPWCCGSSGVDEPLAEPGVSPLACLIDQIKPAHGTAHFVNSP